ncbi:MAG: hypothetical protein EXS29_00690 [Pedosphaera sp.]|nr:hypothetical protein [Pedosphaera sp.]MSS99817.1 hypothetical protein [Pedosphaera sp.]
MAGSFLPFPIIPSAARPTTGRFEHTPFPSAATPTPAVEPDDLSIKLRAILGGLPGVNLADEDLNKSIAAIRGAVQQTPRRMELPVLKVQEGGTADAPTHTPTVALEKDGDQVTRIKVTCACGETIAMDCVY